MTDGKVGENPTVLLVDDDVDFTESVAAVLSDSGFQVLTASNVEQARCISDRAQLDLCVVDLCLSSGELEPAGLAVARELRASQRRLPIIGYSAVHDIDLFGTIESELFDASLPKSAMSPRTLLRAVENWRQLAVAYRHSRESNSGAEVEEKANQLRAFVGSTTTPLLTPSAGLFIGIDEYEHFESLRGAVEDALAMFDYFATSRADGWWKHNPIASNQACYRSQVLVALHELVEHVSDGNTGLFYFAGHGCRGNDGLVLLASDAHNTHVFDTGIPLTRVLTILSSSCRQNARFLVILDCCRSGPPPSAVPSTPNNVTVLYACPQGETTLESSSGGVLTRAIFQALDSRVEREGDTIETRTLRSVFTSIPSIMAAASNAVRSPELIGGLGEEIHLPIMRTTRQREVVTGVPPQSMITTFPDSACVDELQELVSDAYLDCLGAPALTRSWFEQFLDVHVANYEDCVQVRLPDDEGIPNLPCALVQRFPGKFNELQMEWATQLLHAATRSLAEQLKLGWEPLDAGCVISWQSGNLRGQVRVEPTRSNGSLLRVRCFNREGSRLGIENLCPDLNELYNRFRWLTLRMEKFDYGEQSKRQVCGS